jgi:hypothetical protein
MRNELIFLKRLFKYAINLGVGELSGIMYVIMMLLLNVTLIPRFLFMIRIGSLLTCLDPYGGAGTHPSLSNTFLLRRRIRNVSTRTHKMPSTNIHKK